MKVGKVVKIDGTRYAIRLYVYLPCAVITIRLGDSQYTIRARPIVRPRFRAVYYVAADIESRQVMHMLARAAHGDYVNVVSLNRC